MNTSSKTRIAVIGSKGIPSHISGLEVYVQSLTTNMSDEFDITVFCRKRYCDEICNEYKGVKVIYIPSINTKHLDAISYTIFATVVALFQRFDVFWYQALGPSVSMPLPRLFKKRIICTVHGLDWKREKFGKIASAVLKIGEKCIAKYADSIITLNKYDQIHFKEKWQRNTYLIANGIKEVSYREVNDIAHRYGLKKKDYILFLSRIVPEKGVHTLLRAYKEANIEKKLVIAGAGVHTASYESEVKKMAMGDDRIIFTGAVSGKLKEELYSNAYAYVLPSTIEGQSIGLLEAMSYGLPCIVSDIPENTDVIGEYGFCFKCENVDSLKEILACKMCDEKIIADIGIMAQKRVKENYKFSNTVMETKRVIEEMLG